MNSYNEKKRIRHAVQMTALIALIFIIIGVFFVREVLNTQDQESEQYLAEIATQYKNTIQKQIEGDLQVLTTVSTYIVQNEMTDEDIIKQLEIENYQNSFLRMSYVSVDKIAQVVDINGSVYHDIDVSDEDFIIQALAGNNSVSNTFKDKLSNEYMTGYAVPIMRGDEVVGAITGLNTSATFSEILDTSIFSGEGFAFIVSGSNGNIVSRSAHSLIKTNITNIYEDTQLSTSTKKQIESNFTSQQNGFFTFSDNSQEYWTTYQKLDINDWYVLTAVPKSVINKNFINLIQITIILITSILILAVISCFFITKSIKKSRESILKLAYRDELTGIYNKNRFQLEIPRLLKNDKQYALIIINIKNFKFFNELFGFKNGDDLIKYMALTIGKYMHKDEIYYREAADRFGLLMHLTDEKLIIQKMNIIINAICNYALPGEQQHTIILNYGVKILEHSDTQTDLDLLHDRAVSALQRADKLNAPYYFYDEELRQVAQRKNQIENRMYEALENHEFVVYLQPKILLNNGSISGAEALVRWKQPDGSILFPDQFIPVFEENTFVTHLDLYIFETVCTLIEEWLKLGYPVKPISINQSRLLFYQEDYIDNVKGILKRHPIPPEYIILEITESVMTENIEDIEIIINQLHLLGLSISLDDFGSGYSSLNVLKELSIDELKLDRVFLRESEHRDKSNNIMETIIRLVNDLSISSVVEGVETLEQVDFLKSIGCEIAQGYYYSRPIPIDEFVKFAFKK